ncbi:MAG: cell division protein FtsI [Acidimicrobiia bacterium]
MSARTYRILIVLLVSLGAIAVNLAFVQVVRGPDLASDPRNARAIYASFGRWRGPIVTADGVVVAESREVGGELRYTRHYPEGPLFAHITGFTSLTRGDSGLERSFAKALLGEDLSLSTNPRSILDRIKGGKSNATVVLTISSVLQRVAAEALGGRTGAVVAMDPKTGAVLAMYSNPSFDPNPIASLDQNAADRAYAAATDSAAGKPMLSRAFGELRAPGSTFKVVVAAAALEGGYTPGSEFPDPPSLDLPDTDQKLYNFRRGSPCSSGRTITLSEALVVSCNTTFAQLGLALGHDAMRRQAERFGFDQRFDELALDAAVSKFPPDVSFASNKPVQAYAAIGQFDVRATPLQMAVVASAVANAGVVKSPFVVRALESQGGQVLRDFGSGDGKTLGQAMSAANATVLREMMVGVVERGTGRAARIPKVVVAGKTGTTTDFDQAWFIGFAPAQDPRVAVAVLVENEGREATGGQVAAPIARQVMQEALRLQGVL